ncbi:hypothetical protein AAVH_03562 [Aphelenchoides avenae]|nr:hypothetical protein AAVH_03562 [Aphelenchus avenae]
MILARLPQRAWLVALQIVAIVAPSSAFECLSTKSIDLPELAAVLGDYVDHDHYQENDYNHYDDANNCDSNYHHREHDYDAHDYDFIYDH